MPTQAAYDSLMQRLTSATDAPFARLAISAAVLALALALPAAAQVRGAPASVTSDGFGGHENHTPGAPATVTSLGPNGYGHGGHVPVPTFGATPFFPGNPSHTPGGNRGGHGGFNGDQNRGGNGNRHPRRGDYPGYVPIYSYPYAYDYPVAAEPQEEPADQYPEEEYRGGPTIFDRRGSGPAVADVHEYSEPREPEPPHLTPAAETQPAADQPSTVLVFKDGRQLEIQNYAIVGNTLVDMSEGRHRKVPLAELDVEATSKQNDDRGIDFRLPNPPLAN